MHILCTALPNCILERRLASKLLREYLGLLLEVPASTDDDCCSRMKGWLIPLVTGDYVFWIVEDDS